MRFYLRKEAASEEAERPEMLIEDSYIDLRRQGKAKRRADNKIRGREVMPATKIKGQMDKRSKV